MFCARGQTGGRGDAIDSLQRRGGHEADVGRSAFDGRDARGGTGGVSMVMIFLFLRVQHNRSQSVVQKLEVGLLEEGLGRSNGIRRVGNDNIVGGGVISEELEAITDVNTDTRR